MTFLIEFQTKRQRVGRKIVSCSSQAQAFALGRELNAAYGAHAIVVRPVNVAGRGV